MIYIYICIYIYMYIKLYVFFTRPFSGITWTLVCLLSDHMILPGPPCSYRGHRFHDCTRASMQLPRPSCYYISVHAIHDVYMYVLSGSPGPRGTILLLVLQSLATLPSTHQHDAHLAHLAHLVRFSCGPSMNMPRGRTIRSHFRSHNCVKHVRGLAP